VVASHRYRGGKANALVNIAQPLVVATSGGAAAAEPLLGLLAVCSIAGFFYWRALQRARPLPLPQILLVSAAALAIAWCVPVLFSSDVYAYAAYGEMARVGLNPYVRAPLHSGDPFVAAAGAQWIGAFPICLYGPAFVAAARAIVTVVSPLGVLAVLDAFRIAASASLLLCTALAYYASGGDTAARLRTAATIGLNPVAVWCAAEGHNDAAALAVVLAGFVLLRGRFIQIGAAVVALSALVKLPGLAAAIALAVVNARARIGAAIGIVIATCASIPLLAGVATQLAPHGRYAPQTSLQAAIAPLGLVAALGGAAAVAAALAVHGAALLRRDRIEGWIWLGIGAWVLVPNPYPWYGLWLVALAGLAPRTREAGVAMALSLTALLRYVPDAIGAPTPAVAAALGIAATLPLVGLVPLKRWYNEPARLA
jgi:hypothetical protein